MSEMELTALTVVDVDNTTSRNGEQARPPLVRSSMSTKNVILAIILAIILSVGMTSIVWSVGFAQGAKNGGWVLHSAH